MNYRIKATHFGTKWDAARGMFAQSPYELPEFSVEAEDRDAAWAKAAQVVGADMECISVEVLDE